MLLYMITNAVNGKRYIGITTRSMKERWTNHVCAARHPETTFHRAIAKYGASSFTAEIIGTASSLEQLAEMEMAAIIAYDTWSNSGGGYNETFGGIGFHGSHSAETRAKMSKSRLGCKGPVGNKNRLGKTLSAESRAKIVAANTGRVQPQEEKDKRTASLSPVPRTPEWNAAISAAKKGKPGKAHTPESKAKLSVAAKGREVSQEWRDKLSVARLAAVAAKRAAKQAQQEAV